MDVEFGKMLCQFEGNPKSLWRMAILEIMVVPERGLPIKIMGFFRYSPDLELIKILYDGDARSMYGLFLE